MPSLKTRVAYQQMALQQAQTAVEEAAAAVSAATADLAAVSEDLTALAAGDLNLSAITIDGVKYSVDPSGFLDLV